MIKFIRQPLKYVDDFAKIYGDTFTIRSNRSDNHIVYFSQPQALEQIFTADSSYFEVGRGNIGLKFLLGDRSFMLADGDRHPLTATTSSSLSWRKNASLRSGYPKNNPTGEQ
jgi:cytochrome P450